MYAQIIETMGEEKFKEIFTQAPRAAREAYYRKLKIKSKKARQFSLKKDDGTDKTQRVFTALSQGHDELSEELIRVWLMGKRTLLSAALDFFNLPHENGMTESSLDFFKELKGEKVKDLIEALKPHGEETEIKIYLMFMEVPDVLTYF